MKINSQNKERNITLLLKMWPLHIDTCKVLTSSCNVGLITSIANISQNGICNVFHDRKNLSIATRSLLDRSFYTQALTPPPPPSDRRFSQIGGHSRLDSWINPTSP